jgi:hypothetical protein
MRDVLPQHNQPGIIDKGDEDGGRAREAVIHERLGTTPCVHHAHQLGLGMAMAPTSAAAPPALQKSTIAKERPALNGALSIARH